MPTSPVSQSAPLSNAAKDDAVGLLGDHTFTIADLLANDPGGANKLAGHFFFGNTTDYAGVDFAHGGIPSILQQTDYLASHGITANAAFTEFTIGVSGTDIQYMVQIGNKGTWSLADVDVTAAQPVITPHLGGALFTENFDGYTAETQTTYFDPPGNAVFASVDLNAASGWTNASNSELGADGYGGIETTSGVAPNAFWLDTQNSPGSIDISHAFTDTTAAQGGITSVLSFDIAKQSLDYLGNHYETDPDATFEVQVDGVAVATFDTFDFATPNNMQHVEINLASYALAGDNHTISLVDTSAPADQGFTGFAIDSIQINDWVV